MRGRRRGALVWFRRDLRDFDHAALSTSLHGGPPVFAAFVFDRGILDALPSRFDRRVDFIHRSVCELHDALRRRGGGLIVEHGHAREVVPRLARALGVASVHANHDYEPDAIARDAEIAGSLAAAGIAFATSKDQVIFERDEILSRSGRPFSIYTPYRKAWLARLAPPDTAARRVDDATGSLRPPPRSLARPLPALADLGFRTTALDSIGVRAGMSGGRMQFDRFRERIERYRDARDHPALDAPSRLSVHLRFGTVSVRELVAFAHAESLLSGGEGASSWLSELVWREFYAQMLWHHPRVVGRAFRPEYEHVRYTNDANRFAAWKEGRTGYPIVDAGMRELRDTGYMHNRLRMLTASFLVKDLHVHWRLGERHFADLLIDYELASNNGGWQWAASTGSDAQPWFRVFNPVTQSRRFDAGGAYVRRHVPELAALRDDEIHAPWLVEPSMQRARGVVVGRDYPAPIVEHALAREQALEMFKAASRAVAESSARATA